MEWSIDPRRGILAHGTGSAACRPTAAGWHTCRVLSDDLSQPIEWETALRFARTSVRIGYRIAMEEQGPIWNEGDVFGEKFGNR